MPLSRDDHEQVLQVVRAVSELLGPDLVGAYLHGSTASDDLQPGSDLDVLVVTRRPMTAAERHGLAGSLLGISTPELPGRCVELTVVVHGDIRPWRHPSRFDLQYGEWLRPRFEAADPAVLSAAEDPDLTLLLVAVRERGVALVGPPATEVIDAIPADDLLAANSHAVPGLLAALDVDTRNVLLTMARVWCTAGTGELHGKAEAAALVSEVLPAEHRAVLALAASEHRGDAADVVWEVHLPAARAAAEHLAANLPPLRRGWTTARRPAR